MLVSFTSLILLPVEAHDEFPDPGPNGENMVGSVDAGVHGDIEQQFHGDNVDFHMQYAYGGFSDNCCHLPMVRYVFV